MGKEKIKLRKKLRKKGLLSDHTALNSGTWIYCTIQAPVNGLPEDGRRSHREVVTIGAPCQSCDSYASISWRKVKARPIRPIKSEERIKYIKPFRRGTMPTIVLCNGKHVETVLC